MVIGQDVQALPPVGPDDDPRAGLLVLADAVALLVPARLAGDDVDHRGRDGLGDQLEGPIDVLELLVLPGQPLVVRLLVPDLSRRGRRRGGGGGRGAGQRRPVHLCRDERAATIQGHAQEHPESQGRQQHERCASARDINRSPLRGKGREEAGSAPRRHPRPRRTSPRLDLNQYTLGHAPKSKRGEARPAPFRRDSGGCTDGWPDTHRGRGLRQAGRKKNRRTGPAVSRVP